MIYKTKSDDNIYKKLRVQVGLSQKEVSEKLSLNRNSISAWECGRSTPDQSILPKIAELYGTTVDYLLTGKEELPVIKNAPIQDIFDSLSDLGKRQVIQTLELVVQLENGTLANLPKEYIDLIEPLGFRGRKN